MLRDGQELRFTNHAGQHTKRRARGYLTPRCSDTAEGPAWEVRKKASSSSRGLWVADVSLEPWEPDHEMTDRILVHADEVLKRIQVDQGMGPLVRRWVSEALGPAAIPQD